MAENPELDERRRDSVIGLLRQFGIESPDELVVLVRVSGEGVASEATVSQDNLIQSVIDRGRTIQVRERAAFGGR